MICEGDRVRLVTDGGYGVLGDEADSIFYPGAYGTVTEVSNLYRHGCEVKVDGFEGSLFFLWFEIEAMEGDQ